MAKIVIIGSSNTDMVAKTKRMPGPGETVVGGTFGMVAGGKGANQAVCAARLGCDTAFVCCVGDDVFGEKALAGFKAEGLDISRAKTVKGVSSGVALIIVDEGAENSIVVAPGANDALTPEVVDEAADLIKEADILLVQFEIPMESVERAIEIAHEAGTKVVVNPAPANVLSKKALSMTDVIVPNQYEAVQILGKDKDSLTSPADTAAELKALGVGAVVITLGSKGVFVSGPEGDASVPARKVKAVDTTGAGDCFTASMVCALSEGKSLKEAADFGVRASALSVTEFGAQPSMPTRKEVEDFL
ncbi:MAG: ribokinase [Abditibacteriota bacterium]|nr:ribokinase [Abditibacteriota bacterium]